MRLTTTKINTRLSAIIGILNKEEPPQYSNCTSSKPEIIFTMKFYTAILSLACLASSAAAFSAVAPNTPGKAAVANGGGPSTDPIDRTMKGIDAKGSFDPTTGENPALKRNNNDEVWVDQVS